MATKHSIALTLAVLLTMGGRAAAATPADVQRWAVLTAPSLRTTGLPDMLLAGLCELPELQLVERDQIDLAVRELSFHEVLGSGGAKTRLALGKTLRADVLLILDLDAGPSSPTDQRPTGTSQALKIVISECTQGARLHVERIPFTAAQTEAASQRVIEVARQSRSHFAGGIRCVVSVPSFVSKTLAHDYDHLQDAFAYVLQDALASVPGVAVIEVEEAQAIRRERGLAAGPERDRFVPWLIDGEYRVEPSAPGETPRLAISIRVRDEQRELYALQKPDLELAGAADVIRTQGLEWARALAGVNSGTGLSADEQVNSMVAKADEFARLGDFVHATGLREACLLLKPDLHAQRLAAVREYCRLLVPPGKEATRGPDTEEWFGPFDRGLLRWRLSLEHLEYLIRHAPERGMEVFALCGEFNHYVFREWWYKLPNPHGACLERFMQMDELKQRFCREVFPLLRPAVGADEWQDELVHWCGAAFGAQYWTWSELDLEALLWAACECIPLDEPLRPATAKAVIDIVNGHSFYEAKTGTTVRKVVDRLRGTGSVSRLLLARAAMLQWEESQLSHDSVIPPPDTLAACEELLQEIKEYDCGGLMDATGWIRLGLRRAAGLPTEGWGTRRAPQSRPAAEVTGLAERVRFQLRDADGILQPLMGRHWRTPTSWQLLDLLRCGNACDVFWNRAVVLVHRTPGLMQEVVVEHDDSITEPAWDGERLWVACASQGLVLVDETGQIVARIGREQGLPPWDRGLVAFAMGPGKALVAGAFGPNPRLWLATVEAAGRVQVFFEATEAPSLQATGSVTAAGSRFHVGFEPGWIHRPHRLTNENRNLVGIGRKVTDWGGYGNGEEMLVVDVQSLAVAPASAELRRQFSAYRVVMATLPDGRVILPSSDCVLHCPSTGYNSRADERTPLCRSILGPYRNDIVAYADYLYIPRTVWYRLDPRTLEESVVQVALADDHAITDPWIPREWLKSNQQRASGDFGAGVSATLGFVLWSKRNDFYRIRFESPEVKSRRDDTPRVAGARPPAAAPSRPPIDHEGRRRARMMEEWGQPAICALTISVGLLLILSALPRRPRKVPVPAAGRPADSAPDGVASLAPTPSKRRSGWWMRARLLTGTACLLGVSFYLLARGESDFRIAAPVVRPAPGNPCTAMSAAELAAAYAAIDTRQDALAEMVARTLGGKWTPAESSQMADLLLQFLRSDEPRDTLWASAFDACAVLAHRGALSAEQAPAFAWAAEQRPLRCAYFSDDRTINIWGQTGAAHTVEACGVLPQRTVDLLAADGREAQGRVLDGCAAGLNWIRGDSSQMGIEAAESIVVRITTTWCDFGPQFPRDAFDRAAQPEKARLIAQARAKGAPKVIATISEVQGLSRSEFVPRLENSPWWPPVIVHTSQAPTDPAVVLAELAKKRATVAAQRRPADTAAPRPKNVASAPSVETAPAETGTGIVIVGVFEDSVAEVYKVAVGDVITHVQGQPVSDIESAAAICAQSKDSQRTYTLRNPSGERRNVGTGTAEFGIYGVPGRASYESRLIAGAQAFHRRDMAEARRQLEAAMAAGLELENNSVLPLMWAACLYYSGDVRGAEAAVGAFAGSDPSGAAWDDAGKFFRINAGVPNDHLHLVAQRSGPSANVDLRLNQAWWFNRLGRYPEAAVLASNLPEKNLSDFGIGFALAQQCQALGGLGLERETCLACRRLFHRPEGISSWNPITAIAEEHGDCELAGSMARFLFERNPSLVVRYRWWSRQTLRLRMKDGQLAAAKSFALTDLTPEEQRQALATWPAVGYCWAQAQDLWGALARSVAEHDDGNPQNDALAFAVLSMQTQPNIAELCKLVGLPEHVSSDQAQTLSPWHQRALMRIAMIEGDFATAKQLCKRLSGIHLDQYRPGHTELSDKVKSALDHLEQIGTAERDAVSFLAESGAGLTGDQAMWRRTLYLFPIRGVGRLLLTRDGHLGLAGPGEGRIGELPLPESAWWVTQPEHAILVAPSGRTVLATSGPRVYRLNVMARQWELMARMPWRFLEEWDLSPLVPVLDQLAEWLTSHDGRSIDIVWPRIWPAGDARIQTFMLSDGTWLAFDRSAQTLGLPGNVVERALAARPEIYAIIPASPACEQMYVFSDRGLMEWQPASNSIRTVALPRLAEPKCVVPANDTIGVPEGWMRVGLLPTEGGRTFLLCLADGSLRAEGLINEAVPETFWLQRPVEWKRSRCRQAFTDAEQPWPFEAAEVPESCPTSNLAP